MRSSHTDMGQAHRRGKGGPTQSWTWTNGCEIRDGTAPADIRVWFGVSWGPVPEAASYVSMGYSRHRTELNDGVHQENYTTPLVPRANWQVRECTVKGAIRSE
ncbi:hypothetical protein BX600DRAFT_459303 [Xylariales sp. PMI_506]|nr:hypothetical protein BX600DRAFT_459303 [Xylariales sp. PMI_506]